MTRRFFCVLLLGVALACQGIHREQFRGLSTASRAIEGAVQAKSGLPRYRELVSDFDRELSSARRSATSGREQAILARYEEAAAGLHDMLLIWEAKDARGSDMLPISEPLPARIARDYGLGVNTNEPPSIYAGEALQTIWDATKSKLASANASAGG